MIRDRRGCRWQQRWAGVFVAIVLLTTPVVMGQGFQVGAITGVIRNPAGEPVAGTSVAATHQGQGFRRHTMSDSDGAFKFQLLPIGTYRVEAFRVDFKQIFLDVVVESERTTELRVELMQASAEEITVEGSVPLIDRTNATATGRVTSKEFEKAPLSSRSFIYVSTFMPGQITTNVNGSLASTNTYLIDGVDVTDPTTGFSGTDIQFDSVDEVAVHTAGRSAEYGRATGGVISVVTKRGSNDLSGVISWLVSNDRWNGQNTSRHGVTGEPLDRERFDHVNGVGVVTIGAPLLRDRAWIFGSHERSTTTGARRTTSVVPEEFQEERDSRLTSIRGDAEITPAHRLWIKYGDDDLSGIIVDAFGTPSASEREALTFQGRRARHGALQYTALIGSSIAIEAMVGVTSSITRFDPFEESPLDQGSPHLSLADGRPYNGGALIGEVDRPRRQAVIRGSAFPQIFGRHHDLNVGLEWHDLGSRTNQRFPNDRLFVDRSFDPATRTYLPAQRRDYVAGVSESTGDIVSLYLRDKADLNSRMFVELGLRVEKQRGENDAGAVTVDSTTFAPRLGLTYALSRDSRFLIVGTAGRYYETLVQSFSDAFARLPPREIYDLYLWNGREYVFSRRQESAGRTFQPNSNIDPTYIDEVTIGLQRQLSPHFAVGLRAISRTWHDLVDDVQRFSATGITREVVNLPTARRSHRGFEVTFDRRWSRGWNALGSYTFADVRGNHFTRAFTQLGDFEDAMCRTVFDASIGTIPCAEVNDPERLNGRPDYDRRHNLKMGGTFKTRLAAADLTLGAVFFVLGGLRYSKIRTMSVLVPGTTTDAGPTYNYFYESPGSEKVGSLSQLDVSSELALPLGGSFNVSIRGEVFNLTNRQSQVFANNTAFCADPNGTAACLAAREQFGTATTRNSFQTPRGIRLTAALRF